MRVHVSPQARTGSEGARNSVIKHSTVRGDWRAGEIFIKGGNSVLVEGGGWRSLGGGGERSGSKIQRNTERSNVELCWCWWWGRGKLKRGGDV